MRTPMVGVVTIAAVAVLLTLRSQPAEPDAMAAAFAAAGASPPDPLFKPDDRAIIEATTAAAMHYRSAAMLIISLLAAAHLDCAAFAAGAGPPAAVTAMPLPVEHLAAGSSALPRPPGTVQAWRVGAFAYEGYGVDVRSNDPRAGEVVVDADAGLRHPCGFRVWGPSGWNALDANLAASVMRFEPARDTDGPSPGSAAAAAIGAIPVLAGHAAGPSWPMSGGGGFLLGAMHPVGQPGETVLVAFRRAAGPSPAQVLARLTMRVDGLSVTPGLHQPASFVNLAGRMPNGALRLVVLRLDKDEVECIARKVVDASG